MANENDYFLLVSISAELKNSPRKNRLFKKRKVLPHFSGRISQLEWQLKRCPNVSHF